MNPDASTTRSDRWWLGAIALATVALRLPAALAWPVVSVDESSYLSLAALASDHPAILLQHNYHPLYPALLAPIVGGGETLARLASVVLALLAGGCVFGLARERFGTRAGLLAAAAFACLPGPVELGGRILSESCYLPALLGSAWALLRAVRTGGVGAAVVCGLLAGLAYLTRPEGLGPAVVGVGWLLVFGSATAGGASASWTRRGALAAAMLGGALAPALPYMAAIGGVTRKKPIIGAIDAQFHATPDSGPMAHVIPAWVGDSNVGSGERAPFAELLHEWSSGITPVVWLLLLIGIGIVVARRTRPAPGDGALGALVLLYLAVHVWLLSGHRYLSSRHVWPVATLLLPWCSATALLLTRWRSDRWPVSGRAIAACFGLALLGLGINAAAWPWRAGREYLRDAGVRLRSVAAPDAAVLVADMRVAYYAGMRPIIIGRTTLGALLAERARGARYVAGIATVLSTRVRDWREPPSPGARLVAEYPVPSRRNEEPRRFVVYELGP